MWLRYSINSLWLIDTLTLTKLVSSFGNKNRRPSLKILHLHEWLIIIVLFYVSPIIYYRTNTLFIWGVGTWMWLAFPTSFYVMPFNKWLTGCLLCLNLKRKGVLLPVFLPKYGASDACLCSLCTNWPRVSPKPTWIVF